jgi:thymidylate synthase (FAD)
MKLINPSVELITDIDGEAVLRHIEHATRVCYDSNDKVNEESHLKLLKTILDSHHYSVCEHFSVSIKIKCSRACLAQISRHRHLSMSVRSQRYCNFSRSKKYPDGIEFIRPIAYDKWSTEQQFKFDIAMGQSEKSYMELIQAGLKAQDARNALNNAVMTEMVVTANIRAWRDFLKLRTTSHAQDEIRFIALQLQAILQSKIPLIFDEES